MPATNADTLRSIFGDIAAAIRGKLSVQTTYQPDDMAAAIAGIPVESPYGIIVNVTNLDDIVRIPSITVTVEDVEQ